MVAEYVSIISCISTTVHAGPTSGEKIFHEVKFWRNRAFRCNVVFSSYAYTFEDDATSCLLHTEASIYENIADDKSICFDIEALIGASVRICLKYHH